LSAGIGAGRLDRSKLFDDTKEVWVAHDDAHRFLIKRLPEPFHIRRTGGIKRNFFQPHII
jgi:hypothetical protein